jgi:NADPH:quinone reductase-like Zn-dependent oxidoreductase
MQAIVRSRYGSPDVLRLVDLPVPVPVGDEVLVRVHASSVNRADLDYLTGTPFLTRMGTGLRTPRHHGLGLDAAGVVEAVGPGVTRFAPGDAVVADLFAFGQGAFAEYACAPERAWTAKPAGVSFEAAATIPQAALLALQGLRGGRDIKPGDHVLVNGASGNVGPFAVQLAKAFGAEVTGVCSPSKMDFVRSLGADHVIDYTSEDYAASGPRYDWILDVMARGSVLRPRRALRPGGRYVAAGGTTGAVLQAMAVGSLVSLAGSRTLGLLIWWKPGNRDDMARLLAMLEAGTLTPAIEHRYSLAEVPDALRRLEAGLARGKLVITIQ